MTKKRLSEETRRSPPANWTRSFQGLVMTYHTQTHWVSTSSVYRVKLPREIKRRSRQRTKRKRKKKQHRTFPGSLLAQYWYGPRLLNFQVRNGAGCFQPGMAASMDCFKLRFNVMLSDHQFFLSTGITPSTSVRTGIWNDVILSNELPQAHLQLTEIQCRKISVR